MNSTARRWEGGQTMAGCLYVKGSSLSKGKPAKPWHAGRTSKAAVCLGESRWLARRREAGWGDAVTEARRERCHSWCSPWVPVDAWPEGA